MILLNDWSDGASISEVKGNLTRFRNTPLSILEQLSGSNAGAYSNEADSLEADFQTTFYGPNYSKLSAIKAKYDPNDLFIVKTGVGSERWSDDGLCTSVVPKGLPGSLDGTNGAPWRWFEDLFSQLKGILNFNPLNFLA